MIKILISNKKINKTLQNNDERNKEIKVSEYI